MPKVAPRKNGQQASKVPPKKTVKRGFYLVMLIVWAVVALIAFSTRANAQNISVQCTCAYSDTEGNSQPSWCQFQTGYQANTCYSGSDWIPLDPADRGNPTDPTDPTQAITIAELQDALNIALFAVGASIGLKLF